jgi:adenylate kinase
MINYSYPIDAILLLGPTGVGKSPLGASLARHGLFGRHCRHLDFGLELRLAVSYRECSIAYSKNELNFIQGVLERGLLLENEHFSLAEKIISLFLNRTGFSQKDILILNGIPRHAGQAKDMEKIADVHALIVLDCTADDVHNRIKYNVGGDRTDRIDDNKELVKKKIELFRERTAPLIGYYEQSGRRIFRICVSDDMTEENMYEAVSLLAATNPPVTLVTEPPQR